MDYLLVMLATVAVIFGGKAFWDWKKNRTPQLDLEELEEDRAEYLQENFDKATADFKYIEEARKNISDREVSTQLAKMQRVAKKLLANLGLRTSSLIIIKTARLKSSSSTKNWKKLNFQPSAYAI